MTDTKQSKLNNSEALDSWTVPSEDVEILAEALDISYYTARNIKVVATMYYDEGTQDLMFYMVLPEGCLDHSNKTSSNNIILGFAPEETIVRESYFPLNGNETKNVGKGNKLPSDYVVISNAFITKVNDSIHAWYRGAYDHILRSRGLLTSEDDPLDYQDLFPATEEVLE